MNLIDANGRAFVRFLPGDLLAILAFVLVGELQHGGLGAQRYAGALLPFLVGWLVVAPILGAYSSNALESSRSALLLAVTTWLGADLVGQLLRGTATFPGNASPQFFVVAFVFGSLFLAAARFGTLVITDLTGN
jgi:hypothetical protein